MRRYEEKKNPNLFLSLSCVVCHHIYCVMVVYILTRACNYLQEFSFTQCFSEVFLSSLKI